MGRLEIMSLMGHLPLETTTEDSYPKTEVTTMENASQRLQWLIYGSEDWAEDWLGLQNESILRYVMNLLK